MLSMHRWHSDHLGDPNKLSGDGFLANLLSLRNAVPVAMTICYRPDLKVPDFSGGCESRLSHTCTSL